MKIQKAVIPTAGFATRLLPATRTVPKQMMPVLDRPAIHYTVEEAVQAGIRQIVLVISPGQESIVAYFDSLRELEGVLERKGETELLEEMRQISKMADVSHVYQEKPLGLGHAVLMAREAVGDEPFAVFLPDDVIWSADSTVGRMVEIFGERGGSVIGVREVPDGEISSLGIIDPRPVEESLFRVEGLVEKPSLQEAPSRLAIVGRYVLTPEVFEMLEKVRPGALGEIQLTDAISMLLSEQDVYAYRFPGAHFDVGTPLGLLKTSVYAALKREDVSDEFRAWIEGLP